MKNYPTTQNPAINQQELITLLKDFSDGQDALTAQVSKMRETVEALAKGISTTPEQQLFRDAFLPSQERIEQLCSATAEQARRVELFATKAHDEREYIVRHVSEKTQSVHDALKIVLGALTDDNANTDAVLTSIKEQMAQATKPTKWEMVKAWWANWRQRRHEIHQERMRLQLEYLQKKLEEKEAANEQH